MMGAVVKRVNMRAVLGELCIHPVVQALHGSLVIVAARDAALVRDDDDEIAVRIRPADRVNRAVHPDKLLRIVQVVHIHVERAVTVEEDRLIRHRRSTRRPLGNHSTPGPPLPLG